ncbi:hypothetical protein ABK040_006042 [Willaertia magna]
MKRSNNANEKQGNEINVSSEMNNKKQKLKDVNITDMSYQCPYLDTINRKALDFDLEKVCSETMANTNVYCCLIDGKFFKGKNSQSPAFIHSLNEDHHVFLNLTNNKIYCLPDGYEVIDKSLDDIKYNLNPIYSQEDIKHLDEKDITSIALNGEKYTPGFIGLNNIKQIDSSINVTIQTLSRVKPIRNYFLFQENKYPKSILLFSEILRKIWNNKNFKNHVNPQEFIQTITDLYKNQNIKLKKEMNIDPIHFFTWFINHLHSELILLNNNKQKKEVNTNNNKNNSSIISDTFRGKVTITSRIIPRNNNSNNTNSNNNEKITTSTVPYMFLTLDVPPVPLFRDEVERNIIPQVTLYSLLSKFNGEKETSIPLKNGDVENRKYKIESLPPYLIFQIKRFTKNFYFEERNNTIVNFPLRNLDLTEIYPSLKQPNNYYHLVANIFNEGDPVTKSNNYKVHVFNEAKEKWLEIQDLYVKEVLPEEVSISQSFLLVYAKSK